MVDVIGHPRGEAPVVGAVLKGSRAGVEPGPVEGRTQVRGTREGRAGAEGPGQAAGGSP